MFFSFIFRFTCSILIININIPLFIPAKPIRAGQGHNMTGIRGGGILAGGGGVVPQKIVTDDVNKRKSLKGEEFENSF